MKTKRPYPAKAKQHNDPRRQLELLSGATHPSQVFKRCVLERLTPDPVEMEIAPGGPLFSEISQGKVKITFEVGLKLRRYFGSGVLWLVEYQKLYDRQMEELWEVFCSEESKAREREFKARKRKRALLQKEIRQWRAKMLRKLRTEQRSNQRIHARRHSAAAARDDHQFIEKRLRILWRRLEKDIGL